MHGRGSFLLVVACLLVSADFSRAAPTVESEMAIQIDQHLAAAWERERIDPVAAASDAEFLRRAWLDLCGIIPPLNDDDGLSGVRDLSGRFSRE